MTNQEKLYRKVSQQLGIPIKVLEPAFTSQFKTVVNVMGDGNGAAVRLPDFGVFRVKPKRRELLENRIANNKKLKDERKQASGDTEEEI